MRRFLLIYLLISGFGAYSQTFYTGSGWEYHGELTYTAFGWSMSNAGDVNGDGFTDMIVSAIDYSNPEATNGEEGKLFLFYGSPDGLETEPAWEFESNNDSSVLGFSTSGGDLNGDGFSDVVAGCLQWTGDQYNEGRIYLWYGSPSGLNPGEPDWSLDFDQVFALLGSGVALDGDINGDGYNDLFLSAKMWDEPEIEEGKTWLYWGSPDGPVESGWSWQADQEGAISGFPVNYAGDVNGDGFDDVVIGANQYDFDEIDDGLAVSFYGSAAGLNASPDWMMSSGQKKCNFGHWVDGAGDVNGDGYDDVVVSALLYESDSASHNEGRIFVYHGSPSGLSNEVNWYGEINQAEAQFGYSCAGAGDINNDGYADVIGGAKYWDNGELDEGGAFVWFGSAAGLETDYCFSAEGNQDAGYFGRHVGGDADFNNDGYSDFMVGAYRYSEVLEADGKGYAYYGAPRPADFYFEEDTFCIDAINPLPIITGFTSGIFSSDDLITNAATGEINLTASGYGGPFTITYSVDGYCAVSKNIWIEDANAVSAFNYGNDSICLDGTIISPEITIASTGVFSSDIIEIDAITGNINTAAVIPGLVNIYYSGITNAGCDFFDTLQLYFQEPPTLDLEKDTFCIELGSTLPVVNIEGGIFYSPDAILNAETGSIDLMETGVGGPFHIYYNLNNICANAAAVFYIDSADNNLAAFNFIEDSICESHPNLLPVLSGLTGGAYTSVTAVVNTTTGELSVSETPDGEHIIFYSLTTNSGCEITSSDTITIIANPDATFNYFPDTIFIGDVNAVPNIIGEAGIFTVVPEGLLFADVFGVIDLINSTPGSYIIYNTVSNSICTQTDSFTVSILPECIAPQQVTVDYFNSNTLIISWEINIDYTDYTVLLINGEDTLFYTSTDNTITINDLDAETTYIIIVLTNCSSQKTNAADSIVITTAALNLTTSIAPQINIYPNPTSGDITIESDLLAHGGQITIFNLNGQLIYDEIISENYNNYVLKANTLVAGYYYIQISNGYKMHYGSVVIE